MSQTTPQSMQRPTLGITMGEPAGIGPEIVVKALADPAIRKLAKFVVFGMNELMAYAADLAEIEPYWGRIQHDSPRTGFEFVHDVIVLDYDEFSLLGQTIHQPTRQGGQASLAFLKDATDAAMKPPEAPGRIDAIVTAPICKESWHLAGVKWPGHTEMLQALTHAKRSVMMFCAPKLNVALATIHIPLLTLENELTIGRVFDPIDLGHQALKALGYEKPRIAVCGMNPHASEHGLFGDEEERLIEPAISAARELGIDVSGPYPADTIFIDAIKGRYDLVVAMYHDQGLIPVKLLAFDDAVNVTLGLPLIRTSPDHGTAFDIVGKNIARPDSLKAAIRLAVKMTGHGPVMEGVK
ncbi:MAG: 4-hydroxythreonine-4-phosphate dehydrogenase PdxA [Phycisphaerales bacterium]